MATLKEKINYIANNFVAGKPAFTGEPSNEFLMGVISELAADESNYTEFKDSIPAIHKAAMEELAASSNDSKHLLVSSMLKNSGITTSLKEESITQKPVFVEFLLNKANSFEDEKEGNNVLNNHIAELMNHAFDEKNKRIEVSSLIAIANKCVTEAQIDEKSVINRYMSSDQFTGEEYAKYCGALLAFNKLKDSFDYDLTENQAVNLAVTVKLIEKVQQESSLDPTSNVNRLLADAEEKYKKSFFSNDLDIEAQLHKVISENNLAESGGMISGYDLGTPVKNVKKEKAENEEDAEKIALMLTWEERYNKYLNDIHETKTHMRVMTAGDKFQKRFAHHGFAPSTAGLFGDSIVTCDKFGDPQSTIWNISPLTGSMKLSRDVRYDNPAVTSQAFTLAALNARRQGWSSVFLNHPGPDQQAKQFIEESFKAMVDIGDYSFDAIKVPRRYQHVLDHLILQSVRGTIKNNDTVSEELRNAKAIHPEPPQKEEVTDPESTTPVSDKPKQDQSVNEPEQTVRNSNPDTVIPDAFDDKIDFDTPIQEQRADEPLDDFEAARREEQNHDFDSGLDDSHLAPERYEQDKGVEEPMQDGQRYEEIPDEAYNNQHFDNGEIEIDIPEELKKDQKASIEDQNDVTPPKSGNGKRINFRP